MSEKRFLTILQALLTLATDDNPLTVNCIRTTLENIFMLAVQSQKCDPVTLRMIDYSIKHIEHIVRCRSDFISVKGNHEASAAGIHRLRLVIYPGC